MGCARDKEILKREIETAKKLCEETCAAALVKFPCKADAIKTVRRKKAVLMQEPAELPDVLANQKTRCVRTWSGWLSLLVFRSEPEVGGRVRRIFFLSR